MSVLVAYASKHGATKEIAERIARDLAAAGQEVDLRPAEAVYDLNGYDAFVIGSAVHSFRWLRSAEELVKRNRTLLSHHPVWLFSVGPLGPRTALMVKPRDFDTLRDAVDARDHHLFFGAIHFNSNVSERLFGGMFKSVEGDFRDWEEIDAWTGKVADELTKAPALMA